MSFIAIEVLDSGIGIATIDMPDRPFNVFSEQMMSELEATVEQACADLDGLVITSGKRSFVAGADLVMIKDFARMRFDANAKEMKDRFSRLGRLFRRIEQSPIPVVAAINGLALGGGLELAMACHGRVCVDSEAPILGVPEIKLGLFPGAGGTQRLPRLVGVAKAMPLLLDGDPVTPADALALGLVDRLASKDTLISEAVALVSSISAGARWDDDDWSVPPEDVALVESDDWDAFCLDSCGWKRRQHDLYPAVDCIIRCVKEGLPLSVDDGSEAEWDIFVELMSDPIAANMVVTCFLNKGLADDEEATACIESCKATLRSGLAECGLDTDQLALAAKAVDAERLLKLIDVAKMPVDAEVSQTHRSTGLSLLSTLAQKVLKEVSDTHDVIDAVAVLKLGWPGWSGGPIALLAMLQRSEVTGWEPDTELTQAVAAIAQPLKIKASYHSASN